MRKSLSLKALYVGNMRTRPIIRGERTVSPTNGSELKLQTNSGPRPRPGPGPGPVSGPASAVSMMSDCSKNWPVEFKDVQPFDKQM